jgi:hypothetical protein
MKVLDPFYDPADMSLCVEAESSVAQVNARCAADGLYFPLWRNSETSLGELYLKTRLCSRSFRFGSVADNVMGCRFELPGGKSVELGGRVVKNVVGFDFTRFFAGSEGRLGHPRTLVLRLRALAEVRKEFEILGTFPALEGFRSNLLKSPWVHCIDAFDFSVDASGPRLGLAFGCSRAEVSFYEDSLSALAAPAELHEAALPMHEGKAQIQEAVSRCLQSALSSYQKDSIPRSGYLGYGLILGNFERAPLSPASLHPELEAAFLKQVETLP